MWKVHSPKWEICHKRANNRDKIILIAIKQLLATNPAHKNASIVFSDHKHVTSILSERDETCPIMEWKSDGWVISYRIDYRLNSVYVYSLVKNIK